MRLNMFLALIASAGVAANAAPPEPAKPIVALPAKPDEATIAEAIRLLDTDGFDESAMRSTELMIGVSLAAMVDNLHKRFGEEAPKELVEQLRSTIHDHAISTMRSHLPDLKRRTAEVYAMQFTKAELIHLRELHADPLAVKARERAKVMQPQLMKIGVDTMRASEPELDAKIKRIVEDYIAKHGKGTTGDSSS